MRLKIKKDFKYDNYVVVLRNGRSYQFYKTVGVEVPKEDAKEILERFPHVFEGAEARKEVKKEKREAKTKPRKLWTREELEKLSMKELRKIGRPLGAFDTKKSELIEEILEKQKEVK